MRLILVRHADAAEAPPGQPDAARPLTDLGRRQAELLAQFLARGSVACDRVFASPAVRTMQTAGLLLASVAPGGEVESTPMLAGERFDALAVAAFLVAENPSCALVVGHMPGVAELAEYLTGAEQGSLDFAKGAAMSVTFAGDVAEGAGLADWYETPETLVR